MLLSKTESVGWAFAVSIVAVMGILVFSGPFHRINKTHAASGPVLHVKIVTDAQTIGRFTPSNITTKVGEPITFTNDSNTDHTATSRDNSFNSENIATGASWVFTPAKAGTFQYVCSYHPLMLGTIHVNP